MITISATFNRMVVSATNVYDQEAIQRMTGKVKELSIGQYEMALSHQNLTRLYRMFQGANRPQVISGKRFIDELREKLLWYYRCLDGVESVLREEAFPIEPNGKFVPYKHQTKIIGCQDVYPYTPTMADCGTGKTGSTLRSIEYQLRKGTVRPGKILISCPLSIVKASWMQDAASFTHLRVGLLWTSKQNKKINTSDDIEIINYGPKPEGNIVTIKKRSGKLFYRNIKTGQVKNEKPDSLDGPKTDWESLKGKYTTAEMEDGQSIPFGPVLAKTYIVEETRKNFIKEQLANPEYDIFIINHEGVRIYEDILKEHGFDWVCVDESTKIKTPGTAVSASHVNISWKSKRRTILTGTPNPNGFEDLWHQFYFLDRGLTLEPCLNDFLQEYFVPKQVFSHGGTNANGKIPVKWVPRSKEDMDRLIATVRRTGIYLDQRDCLDLPPRTDMVRTVTLSDEQEKAYLEMEESLYTSIIDRNNNNLTVEATNKLAQIMRLRQITSGFMASQEGIVGHFKTNPKWLDLDAVIEELGDKKLVIACQFKEEIYALLDRYKDLGISAIYGGVGVDERTNRIRDFQTTDKIRIMILQPAAAAHGITLTAAHYLHFLSLDYNFELYYQVAKRIERIGQKSNMFVLHSLAILGDGSETIDSDLMYILDDKGVGRTKLFSFGKDSVISDEDLAEALESRLIERVEKRKQK